MKNWLFFLFFLHTLSYTTAQTSISFYHLGNTTYQNSNYNPSWIPEGKVFVGLPGISGIHIHANSKLSYNQLFTKNSENDTVLLDITKGLSNLQNQNLTSVHAGISLLHIGFRFKQGSFISLFANERIETDVLYSKEILEYLWQGNANFLNEEVKISNVGAKATHFREIGIGYAYSPNSRLDIGARAKYLIGFVDASLPHNFSATLTSTGNSFDLNADWENAQLRTAGIDIVQGNEGDAASYFINNTNTGFGLDLGATYHLSKTYSISGAITDIGFINWKEDITNYTLNDTTFTYTGVDLGEEISSIREVLIDSLFDKFTTTETSEPYKSWLPLRATGSWIYHFDNRTDVYATVSSRFVQRQVKVLYGGGITRKFGKSLTLSASATKLPQQFFNVGAALAFQGGPMQFYMAADQVINFSIPDAKAIDFRFGINLIFGKRKEKEEKVTQASYTDPKGYDTNYFLGQPVRTKKREGVYSIINKQRKRDVAPSKPSKKSKVSKKSLNKVKPSSGGSKKKKVEKKSTTKRKKN